MDEFICRIRWLKSIPMKIGSLHGNMCLAQLVFDVIHELDGNGVTM